MRHLAIESALVLSLVAGGAIPAAMAVGEPGTFEERSSLDLPGAGLHALTVENARGRVTVALGTGGDVRIQALKIVRAAAGGKAHQLSSDTQVVTETHGGELRVRVLYPQRQRVRIRFWDLLSKWDLPRVEVRLTIEVPEGLALHLRSSSGDLFANGIRAEQVLESTSGDVTVTQAGTLRAASTSGDVAITDTGAADLETVSGDISATAIHGPLRAASTSGDLRIRGTTRGTLELESVSGAIQVDEAPAGIRAGTTSGAVEVHRASGAARIKSASGDIVLGMVPPLERADLSTSNGDVRLDFAKPTPCTLDLSTSSGDIHVDLPLDDENSTRHHVTGVVRHGTAPVVVHTASGDITLAGGAR